MSLVACECSAFGSRSQAEAARVSHSAAVPVERPAGGHDAPPAPAAAPLLRPFAAADLPEVARLFRHVFQRAGGSPPAALVAHLKDVYLDHPWYDPETPSLVFADADGRIEGFIGVLPLRLRFRGAPLRASVAGALMVRDPARQPMAGARLMRAYMSGPQALSLGDTANWTSKTLWERIGGRTLPLASLEWLSIIRTAGFGVSVLRNKLPGPLAALLAPASGLAGLVGRRRTGAPLAWSGETVDDETWLSAFAEVTSGFAVTLDPDPVAGRWFLAEAARKKRHGPLYRRVVRDKGGRVIGCYLVYAKRGAVAQTLQLVAQPRQGEAVFASLLGFAAAEGCVGARGQSHPGIMDALFKAGCILRHRGATVADTDDAALMQALEAGSAPFGGFFGETWLRLVSDDFA